MVHECPTTTYNELISLRLSTERLLLRPLDETFCEPVCEYLSRNRSHFERAGPLVNEEFFTPGFQRRRLALELEKSRLDQHLRLYVFRRDDAEERIIGDIGFSHIIFGALRSCFMGYKIDRDHVRRGYATEAVGCAVDYVFAYFGLHRIEANIMPSNVASLALIERLGFSREGYSPSYLRINGQWEDHVRYALLNPDDRPGT